MSALRLEVPEIIQLPRFCFVLEWAQTGPFQGTYHIPMDPKISCSLFIWDKYGFLEAQ
jgi:hypothetical protein